MKPDQQQLRRAAVLVSALDADAADALLERLSADHAALVRRTLIELDEIDPGEQQIIMRTFLGGREAAGEMDSGVELQLSSSAPVEPVSAGATFRFLHEAELDDLCDLLAGERPQTVAVVVSHLPAERATSVIAKLPADLQGEVLRRLTVLDEADPAILRDIEESLERRFRSRVAGDRTAGVGAVKGILKDAAPQLRRTLLSNIARQDPDLAERLTQPNFGFADLVRLDDASLHELIEETAEDYVATALAGGELPLVRRFLSVLPRHRADRLQRAIDTLGPTRLSDVELAQQELVDGARRLEASGRLEWITTTTVAAAA